MFRSLLPLLSVIVASASFAHHGWSGFDETKPIYVEGVVRSVSWQNPHAEVVLEINHAPPPAALTRFAIPRQTAQVDAVLVLGSARPPGRKDVKWEVEFAPITRMDAWKVAPIKVGEKIAVVGYTFKDEKGDAVLRAEFLIGNGKVTPMRSSPP